MKQIKLVLILLLFTGTLAVQTTAQGQFAAIDKKMLQIPDSATATTQGIASYINASFANDKEKTRAIFSWIVNNIAYDADNMFAINFYGQQDERISKPLRTRKGICENFAALFNDICLRTGIQSFVVDGYTRQNGFTDYIPHAWCAAYVDGTWWLIDPTWGSGYLTNRKFVKKINNGFYMTKPSALIKSHMPFDPLWQFLNYPVTSQEFMEERTAENQSKPFFNFTDTLQQYEKLDHIEQLKAACRRIQSNGVKHALTFDRLQHFNAEIENYNRNKDVDLYNSAVADYNDGVFLLNTYLQYWNNQFTPLKQDVEIQQMMDTASNKLKAAKNKLQKISNPDANAAALITQLTKSMGVIDVQVKEQQEFLAHYFSRPKAKRKSLFYEKKTTWFGIPIN
jgi:hypothetical protein